MQEVFGTGAAVPTGLIFSCLMLCLTLGGFAFPVALQVASVERCACAIFAVSALALLMPALCSGPLAVMVSLLVFEFCIGMFYPCAATLRSQYIPDAMQESVMNILRLPVNVLVVVGTWLAGIHPPNVVFCVCAGWLTLACALQFMLARCQESTQPVCLVKQD